MFMNSHNRINDGKFVVEHKFVDYDNQKASNILAQRSFGGAGELAQMLLNPSERHL